LTLAEKFKAIKMSLATILSEDITDPRRGQGIRTPLPKLFTMIIISNLCGHFGGRASSRFCRLYESTFKEYLELKHAIPSHVTFSDVLNRVDENEVISAFNKWSSDYVELEAGDLVSGDGKALGSTVENPTSKHQKFQAIVSIFCHKSGLVHSLKQYHNSKKSEINIVQFLVENLQNKGITFFSTPYIFKRKQSNR